MIEHATELARLLAQPRDDEVVVNRDALAGNILSPEREPWLLIDPKPLVGEPAFDAGYLVLDRLGERPTVARTDALVERIAQGLGIEAERARAWALLRAVDNALWSLSPAADLAKAMALMG